MAYDTGNIIEVKNFGISFAGKTIIKSLSFNVKRGETFGLLGSNGSGKTTTIRALLGLYQPDAGKLLINGKPFDPNGETKIGYLPEERGLYKKENVIDTMAYFGRLKNVKKPREWSMSYLKRVGLERRLLMEIIEELHQKGSTIILITHYMDEVEKLCDHILLLKDGVARASGTISEVRRKFHKNSLDQIFIDIYGEQEEQYNA